jgi:hypothetical protein
VDREPDIEKAVSSPAPVSRETTAWNEQTARLDEIRTGPGRWTLSSDAFVIFC